MVTPAAPDGDETAEGVLTEDFLTTIGTRIRSLRTQRSFTVQELADRSGISRRLLTQIEHGQANPSLVTVTRIARQLGTEFTALLSEPETAAPILARTPEERTLVWSSQAGSTAHLLLATGDRSADLWHWRITPGDSYTGRPDPDGSEELFHVLEGRLTIRVDGHETTLDAGDSARLLSDRDYSYLNADDHQDAVFVRVVALSSAPRHP